MVLMAVFLALVTLYGHSVYQNTQNYSFLLVWLIHPIVTMSAAVASNGNIYSALITSIATIGILITFVVKRNIAQWVIINLIPLLVMFPILEIQ
jgi:hypothetical protein